MFKHIRKIISLTILLACSNAQAQIVRFETNLGNVDIELYAAEAPVTVNNFLNYVNQGDYDDTVIHRTDPGFIIQGGGYRFNGNNQFQRINTNSPIINEASLSNSIGTISMARTNDPNSATNQWFFNLANNDLLNSSNGNAGYAVFGKVINGMETLYVIESLLRVNYFDATPAGVFGEFPLFRFDSDGNTGIIEDNMVKINKAFVLSDVFQINAGLSGAWFNPLTNGQGLYMEVLPAANTVIVGWYTFDDEAPATSTKAIGDESNRWLTAIGNFQENTFVGTVFKTSGGVFDDPQAVSNTEAGEMSIVFNNCTTAVFSYSLDEGERANSMNIQRISGANVALCEELARAANQGVSAE